MALLRRQRETATVLLLEKPLAEDPDHGESARHEPFQEALLLGPPSSFTHCWLPRDLRRRDVPYLT